MAGSLCSFLDANCIHLVAASALCSRVQLHRVTSERAVPQFKPFAPEAAATETGPGPGSRSGEG